MAPRTRTYDLALNEAIPLRYHYPMSRYFPASRMMQNWSPLEVGDVVDIIAPASACKVSELKGAVRFLKGMGLKPRYSSNIFLPRPDLFAQSDAIRFLQLKKALLAPDSKAIWCVRGGYGALRLLPELQKVKRPKSSKLFIGYSDITTLHGFLNSQWHWPTMHGPLLDRFGRGGNLPQETKEIFGMLFGQLSAVEFSNLKPMNRAARSSKIVRGKVVGGNLAVLQSSLGTPWQVLPHGHIVFFEDRGERPHRMDRMLTQMAQAGYFARARAVVFGDIIVSDRKDQRLLWRDVLPRFAESLKIPVLYGLKSGHGAVQRPVPLMTPTELFLSPRGSSLMIASGAHL